MKLYSRLIKQKNKLVELNNYHHIVRIVLLYT